MIKRIALDLLFSVFITTFSLSNSNVYIYATVDDEIITNHDIEKESEYLKILNPGLTKISKKKILDLSKNSLIREIIKKKEIIKFLDIKKENTLINNYLNDLFTKLNYKNQNELIKDLQKKNNKS